MNDLAIFKDLPAEIIDLIFDYIDDIDTRRGLGLNPRRIKIQDSFVKMFDKLPKPIITNHAATLSLGPMRPTYYDEDLPSFHPTYLIIRIQISKNRRFFEIDRPKVVYIGMNTTLNICNT
jgi:hypothetical protein